MSDPTKAEPRYDTGETAQEAVDRQAGGKDTRMGGVSTPVASQGSPHPATYPVMAKPPGPSTHPSSTHTYGAPIGMPILKARDGT